MNDQVIDNFKDIIFKIVRYYGINNYGVEFIGDTIKFHIINNMINNDNIINNLNRLLISKIYKYKQLYWKFTNIQNGDIIEYQPSKKINQINGVVKINIIKLTTYFQLLPLELLNIITSNLIHPDLGNLCTYMQTWGDYCNDDLYKSMYIKNFSNYYRFILPYIQYENNSWYFRYIALLFEDIYNIEILSRQNFNVNHRNSHIAFILLIYNIKENLNYKNLEYLYNNNINLLKNIINNMQPIKLDQLKKIVHNRNINIYKNLFTLD